MEIFNEIYGGCAYLVEGIDLNFPDSGARVFNVL
jgi:hypothetical protein